MSRARDAVRRKRIRSERLVQFPTPSLPTTLPRLGLAFFVDGVVVGTASFVRPLASRIFWITVDSMTISTRRFFARPASVSFGATGRRAPKPWAVMRDSLSFIVSTRYRNTVSARAVDSSQFDAY